MNVTEEILALERAALDRWGRGDPSGFIELCAEDVTYFDPFLQRRLDGLEALRAYYASLAGKVHVDRWEFVGPRVRERGDAAVLTFDYVSWSGAAESRWHCTDVYARLGGAWRIVDTHWSRAPGAPSEAARPVPEPVLGEAERAEIARLWGRKLDQDARRLPQGERHRNLEPESAELLACLAAGARATRILEIGGSSGLSTIALAAAARRTGGRVLSIEIDAARQAEARTMLAGLGLSERVELLSGDAAALLPALGPQDLVLIDCEKDDYVRFFDMLRLAPGAIVVADNILSHGLTAYVAHVRAVRGAESVTVPVGKGLELTRFPKGGERST